MFTTVRYDKSTKDWNCYAVIDGNEQYIGSGATPSEAEATCREYRFSFYADCVEAQAREMEAGK
jgi:hypothetical protein